MSTLRKYLAENNIKMSEAAAVLRKDFPLCRKNVLSMACRPETYGVELTAEAQKKLTEHFTPGAEEPKAPDRVQLRCRVNPDFAAFVGQMAKAENATVQETIYRLITSWLSCSHTDEYMAYISGKDTKS